MQQIRGQIVHKQSIFFRFIHLFDVIVEIRKIMFFACENVEFAYSKFIFFSYNMRNFEFAYSKFIYFLY